MVKKKSLHYAAAVSNQSYVGLKRVIQANREKWHGTYVRNVVVRHTAVAVVAVRNWRDIMYPAGGVTHQFGKHDVWDTIKFSLISHDLAIQ